MCAKRTRSHLVRFVLWYILRTMDNEIRTRLEAQDQKLDAIYVSVEKTRKYFQIILWGTLATVVVPLIGILIGIPIFLNSYMSQMEGLL